jgi:hypothetical protein
MFDKVYVRSTELDRGKAYIWLTYNVPIWCDLVVHLFRLQQLSDCYWSGACTMSNKGHYPQMWNCLSHSWETDTLRDIASWPIVRLNSRIVQKITIPLCCVLWIRRFKSEFFLWNFNSFSGLTSCTSANILVELHTRVIRPISIPLSEHLRLGTVWSSMHAFLYRQAYPRV